MRHRYPSSLAYGRAHIQTPNCASSLAVAVLIPMRLWLLNLWVISCMHEFKNFWLLIKSNSFSVNRRHHQKTNDISGARVVSSYLSMISNRKFLWSDIFQNGWRDFATYSGNSGGFVWMSFGAFVPFFLNIGLVSFQPQIIGTKYTWHSSSLFLVDYIR